MEINDIFDPETRRLMIIERRQMLARIDRVIDMHGAQINKLRARKKEIKTQIANLATFSAEREVFV
jgi:hypothetical protein